MKYLLRYPLWLCKKTLTIKSNIYNNHIFVQSWYCGYWCGSLINYINLSQITCLVHQYLKLYTCGFFETVFAFLHTPGNISASPFVHANIRETFCISWFLFRNFKMPSECVLCSLTHTYEIITNWLIWQSHGNYF